MRFPSYKQRLMSSTADIPNPLENFSECHAGILEQLDELHALPGLLEPAARARRLAAESIAFFRDITAAHHEEEERELFPAVLADARPGEEQERVRAMVQRLTREHRAVEIAWKRLERGLRRVAKGHDADIDVAELHRLLEVYSAHARYEENEFLPLSAEILGRNRRHLAALGLSLHLRTAKTRLNYI